MQTLIPRIFHRIWLGPSPLPEIFVSYGETWMNFHPEWKMMLWTESNLFPLANQKEFDEAETWAGKANIARYEVIQKFGGVYIDTDFECLQCIEPLLGGIEAFAAHLKDGRISNAIFGAIPNHAFVSEIARLLPGYNFAHPEYSTPYRNGLYFFDKVVRMLYPDLTIFTDSQFYPYDSTEKHFFRKPFNYLANAQAFAVHHWEFSWVVN